MSKIKVVHYINQFFAQIGGEEKADYPAEIRVGEVVGPGMALNCCNNLCFRILKMKQRLLQQLFAEILTSMRTLKKQKQIFLQW